MAALQLEILLASSAKVKKALKLLGLLHLGGHHDSRQSNFEVLIASTD